MDYAEIDDTIDKLPDFVEDVTEAHRATEISTRSQQINKKMLLVGRDRWTKSVFTFLLKCKGKDTETIVGKIVSRPMSGQLSRVQEFIKQFAKTHRRMTRRQKMPLNEPCRR